MALKPEEANIELFGLGTQCKTENPTLTLKHGGGGGSIIFREAFQALSFLSAQTENYSLITSSFHIALIPGQFPGPC